MNSARVGAGPAQSGVAIAADISAEQIQALRFAATPAPANAESAHHQVVVVGAGPVGLSLAIDLAQRGQRVLLLDNDDRLSTGSRAICFAQRTLQIWDRLGCGDAMVDKGVSWQVGRVFHGAAQVYQFDLQTSPPRQAAETESDASALPQAAEPRSADERPAFINLQQFYVEAYLLRRALELPNIELRWKHELVGITAQAEGVQASFDTQNGRYTLSADYLCACDGSRSAARQLMGLESQGRSFRDRFLIADIRMQADFPAERWFWFDPPFHRGFSVLLHRQSDGVWRIDWQLGWEADPELERQPQRIGSRVQAMMRQALGHEVVFELVWASVYTFSCLRMQRFAHGRVLFAGDSAHGVSPFGARGANSGVQDAENLAWKLDAVLRAAAPPALLDSYDPERGAAADENILHSTRATDFITPKSEVSRLFRDAVLSLSARHAFARRLVNSGRLSVPAVLDASPLNTPDEAEGQPFTGGPRPGAVAADAPLQRAGQSLWLLRLLSGQRFTLLCFGAAPHWAAALGELDLLAIGPGQVLQDPQGLAAQRYDARAGTAYLIRPDQHVAARWRTPSAAWVRAALQRALARAV